MYLWNNIEAIQWDRTRTLDPWNSLMLPVGIRDAGSTPLHGLKLSDNPIHEDGDSWASALSWNKQTKIETLTEVIYDLLARYPCWKGGGCSTFSYLLQCVATSLQPDEDVMLKMTHNKWGIYGTLTSANALIMQIDLLVVSFESIAAAFKYCSRRL